MQEKTVKDHDKFNNFLQTVFDRAVNDIIDEQGNQFFREMIGPIIVGTIGDDRWQSIGVMKSAHEMIARGF